ncbi:uncharacterized protein LOC135439899 [Drosophila montana]|uniref:uncharacterized protein LOC135439899 n=1 Tax=Drosophila montana TaxID=40370 RepID=UPI00313B53DA
MSTLESSGSSKTETMMELIDILLDFMDITKEPNLKRVIQFAFGILNTNNIEKLQFASKLISKLFAVIFPDPEEDEVLQTRNPQLVSDFILCVQMWTGHFPDEGKFLLAQLCSRTLNNENQPHAGQILVQLMDDILRDLGAEYITSSKLYCRILKLLESNRNEERISGHLLLKKLLDKSKCTQLNLFSYINVMECLNIEQSPQNSASLSARLSLLKENDTDGNWMRIFYSSLLQDSNIPRLHSSLVFIMDHFTIAELFSAHLLKEFLAATNSPNLHDMEGINLPEQQMKKFLSDNAQKQFFKAFGEVAWYGVPLCRWLDCIETGIKLQITKKHLLKISELVRNIANLDLRNSASNRFCEVFKVSIESLSVGDFMTLIRTLYNDNDIVCAYGLYLLVRIIENSQNINEEMVNFTKSFYESLSDKRDNYYLWDPLMELLRQFEHVPKTQHGWWRLPAFFSLHNNDEVRDFYRIEYDVNIELINECKNLKELQKHLIYKLNCQTEEETYFVMQQSVDLFLEKNVHHWSQLEEFHLDPVEVLENGAFKTLSHLSKLLSAHDKRLQDEKVIETFQVLLRNYPRRWVIPGNILKYVYKHLDIYKPEKLLDEMIANSSDGWELGAILCSTNSISVSKLINGLLYCETPTGVSRNAYAYLNSLSTWNINDHIKRNNYITYVSGMYKEQSVHILFNELLNINEHITVKESVENSRDHRIQMRIARTLFNYECFGETLPEYVSDKLWTALVAPNNPLNITYLFECLVAKLLPSFQLLMEKLKSLTSLQSHQQESIISVVYIYCMRNWDSLKLEQLQTAFELLWLHMMTAKFQTMFFSQLVLHRLAVRCEEKSIDLPFVDAIKSNLELLIGDKTPEYRVEARLLLPEILKYFPPADSILYMTNAPFDEYNNPKWEYSQNQMKKLDKIRTAFKAKGLTV